MIDYLIIYPDDATRSAAYPAPGESPPTWRVEDMDVLYETITLADATYDADGNMLTPSVRPGGSWLRLRTDVRRPEIDALPNCLLAVDTDRAAAGEPYVYFHRFAADTILGQISPMFAGDEYTIPVGQTAAALDEWIIPTP